MRPDLYGEPIYSSPPDAFIAWHPEKGYRLSIISKVRRNAEKALENFVKDKKLDGWHSKMARIRLETGWVVVPIKFMDIAERT